MKQIIMDIFNDGEVKIATKGYSGKSCVEESQFLKDVLGEEIERQLIPAYYQENGEVEKLFLPLCG